MRAEDLRGGDDDLGMRLPFFLKAIKLDFLEDRILQFVIETLSYNRRTQAIFTCILPGKYAFLRLEY
jgi:hypothetical protein